MKYFKDSANTVFAYDADGSQDDSIQPGLVPITLAEADALRFLPQTLDAARASKIAVLTSAYQSAIAQDVTFRSAGAITQTFQADAQSIANLQAMVAAYGAAGVPTGFYWVAKDNTRVPFSTADLQGLAKAMGDQGWAAFSRLQDRKASILAATTISAVQAITWA